MAVTAGTVFRSRKLVRRVTLGLGCAVLLCGAVAFIAIREAKETERRAERFLREFLALEVGKATPQQVTPLIDRYGARWQNASTYYRSRDEDELNLLAGGARGTDFGFEFRNRWLACLHLAPEAVLSGDVFVTGGRVVFRSVRFSSGQWWTFFTAVVYDDSKLRPGETDSVLLMPLKTIIRLTPSASQSLRERAYRFNLGCLSKIGGCKDAREVLPGIWANAHKDETGMWVMGPEDVGKSAAPTESGLASPRAR